MTRPPAGLLENSTTMKNPNLAIVNQFVAAVTAGDADTLKALCADQFELHEGSGLTFAGVYAGSDGFLKFLGIFAETLDIERMELLRSYVSDDDDYVISEMELVATIRATGKPFASTLLERWKFRDGKVLSIKPHYFNAM